MLAAAVAAALLVPGACPPDANCKSAKRRDFEAVLAAHASATEALRAWCGLRRMVEPDAAQITAGPVSGSAPPPRNLGQMLKLNAGESLAYRHVRLSCGDIVLSEAHNWYVPARLTEAMNRQLAETDTPFGQVAAPLHFTREPLASRRGRAAPCPADTISTHRARLRLPDGRPLAYVVECYTRANLEPRIHVPVIVYP